MSNTGNFVNDSHGYVKFTLNEAELMSNRKGAHTGEEKYNRNFAGTPKTITLKRGGQQEINERFGYVLVPDDMIDTFREYGIQMWEIDRNNPNREKIMYKAKIKLTFNSNPTIKLVNPNQSLTDLTKDTVAIIDDIHVKYVDVELGRGKNCDENGFYALWVNTMYVYQDLPDDPFAYKFANITDNVDDEDCPF